MNNFLLKIFICVLFIMFSTILIFADTTDIELKTTAETNTNDIIPTGSNVFLFSEFGITPEPLKITLSAEQEGYFKSVMYWNNWSIGMLAANTAAIVVANVVDPFVGQILGILSLGGWTITTGFMAYGYRDMLTSFTADNTDAPSVLIPFFASIGAASFGMGAITALGLTFTDDTGTAEVLTYICTGISGISGIVAIVSTFMYKDKIEDTSVSQTPQDIYNEPELVSMNPIKYKHSKNPGITLYVYSF